MAILVLSFTMGTPQIHLPLLIVRCVSEPKQVKSVAFWRSLERVKRYKLDSVSPQIFSFLYQKYFHDFLKGESSSLVNFIFLVKLQNLLCRLSCLTQCCQQIISSTSWAALHFSAQLFFEKMTCIDPPARTDSFGEFNRCLNVLQNRGRLWTWKNFLLKLC